MGRLRERASNANTQLLTVRDVQEETQVVRTKLYALIASGELGVVRIGRSVRIPRASLELWIREKTEKA